MTDDEAAVLTRERDQAIAHARELEHQLGEMRGKVKRLELITHTQRADFPRGFYEACGFTEVDAAVLRMPAIDFRR